METSRYFASGVKANVELSTIFLSCRQSGTRGAQAPPTSLLDSSLLVSLDIEAPFALCSSVITKYKLLHDFKGHLISVVISFPIAKVINNHEAV